MEDNALLPEDPPPKKTNRVLMYGPLKGHPRVLQALEPDDDQLLDPETSKQFEYVGMVKPTDEVGDTLVGCNTGPLRGQMGGGTRCSEITRRE